MSQPRFVRGLTGAEQKELTRLIRGNGDARIVRRAQMIRLSSQGQTTSRIAALWAMPSEVVRRLIHRFNADGLGARYCQMLWIGSDQAASFFSPSTN